MKALLSKREVKKGHRAGGFGIEILYPGLVLDHGDSGIGALGRIDHARINPGMTVRMHPHRDDEILTYMRSGTMRHRDTEGNEEELTPRRLMLMNAGHTFQHEEAMVGRDLIEALQIFVRPRAGDLEPRVQFHDLAEVSSLGAWRLIAAPEGGAPLEFRASAWVHDTFMPEGTDLDLPPVPGPGVSRLLYVFAGQVNIGDFTLSSGDSLLVDASAVRAEAAVASALVLFTMDTSAPTFTKGMFSGNILAP